MKQQTFSDMEYANRRKKTKRDEFLEIMEEIIPMWNHTILKGNVAVRRWA
jgi:IS5 family transposase